VTTPQTTAVQPPAAQPVTPTATTQTTGAPIVVANGPTPVVAERAHRVDYRPNPALFWTGLTITGLSYGSAAVAGGTSRLAVDRDLFIPIAGPWIDLANRPGCGPSGSRACDEERGAKIAMTIDGIAQGLGTLMIAGAFVWPDRSARTITTTAAAKPDKPTLHVTPQRFGAGYGVGAVGTF